MWTPTPDWTLSFNSYNSFTDDGNPTYNKLNPSDSFEVNLQTEGYSKLDTNTQALKVGYNGEGFRATSITARRFTRQENVVPGSTGAVQIIDGIGSTLWTQELRLQSPETAKRFQWLLGSYYESRDFNVGDAQTDFPGSGRFRRTGDDYRQTYAVFGQVDYQLIEPLTVFAGLRYESSDASSDSTYDLVNPDGTLTPALAVNLLEPRERGLGNAIQAGGNIFGAIIGGGGVLILLDRIGWRYSLIIMSVVILLTLIPVILYKEQVSNKSQKSNFFKSYFHPFINFLSRPKALPWLFVVLLYMGGEMMSGTMLRPLFVDRGLSLSDIGLMLGIVSYSARIVSALIAGVLITHLGRLRSLTLFGFAASMMTLLYIIPAIGISSLPVLYAVSITVNAAQSMAYTALLSAMMDKCEPATAATDYTLQVYNQ